MLLHINRGKDTLRHIESGVLCFTFNMSSFVFNTDIYNKYMGRSPMDRLRRHFNVHAINWGVVLK